ncbi:MAG: metallophosphoesterase family protein [Candidatus Hodarchaeales archaeon]|jgi:putative phosphoesterase
MKLIGLISDTHIPSRRKTLPESVITAFENVDMIIHSGDFEELNVAFILEEIAPLTAVRGNMCHPEVKNRYPKKEIVQVENLTIGIIHGSGGPSGYYQRIVNEFNNSLLPEIIISGHTHQPVTKKINTVQFINPGSPTDKRFAPRNTVALLEIDGKDFDVQFVEIKR